MNYRTLVPVLLILWGVLMNYAYAQKTDIKRVEPLFWWTGMKNPELQVLVYGTDIASTTPAVNYPGVSLQSVDKVDNPNYLFLNFIISETAKPGKLSITFSKNNKVVHTYEYELKERKANSAQRQGYSAADVMYLLMPDRFSNGDPSNDSQASMIEKLDRSKANGRHGGDLQGVMNKIDYLHDLGVTTIWMNPFTENNMPNYSYHGYAITDFYKVDARIGTNEQFAQLSDKLHAKDMKVIMDMVFNHCAIEHWFIKDLPSKDWIHQWPEFTRTNYRAMAIVDPYASDMDRKIMSDGWFDSGMPDLDQQNPFLATYLIQNTIWWIEFGGLDGIRVDTQPYPDQVFMANWAAVVMSEYPNFNIVGEAWLNETPFASYWSGGTVSSKGYDSNFKGITDFPLYGAVGRAFHEGDGWDSGIKRLYYVLAQDYMYGNPMDNVVFVDNHDVGRFMSGVGHDVRKYKMGLAFILTTRGIPQIYYGTEIGMTGHGQEHGDIRKDFPGGWTDDSRNAFTAQGRTGMENEVFDYLQNILVWRKSATAIHNGTLKHFIPENDIYVYFRSNDDQTVMVIMNNNDGEYVNVNTARFAECMDGFSSAYEVTSGKTITDLSSISIYGKQVLILDLKK